MTKVLFPSSQLSSFHISPFFVFTSGLDTFPPSNMVNIRWGHETSSVLLAQTWGKCAGQYNTLSRFWNILLFVQPQPSSTWLFDDFGFGDC